MTDLPSAIDAVTALVLYAYYLYRMREKTTNINYALISIISMTNIIVMSLSKKMKLKTNKEHS